MISILDADMKVGHGFNYCLYQEKSVSEVQKDGIRVAPEGQNDYSL
jgi:hypothetical protein